LLKFADRLKDVGALEGLPKMEGKRMLVMFAPKAQQKQKKGSELGKLVEKITEEKKQPEAPKEEAE
jgi:translation initiation factor IF-3